MLPLIVAFGSGLFGAKLLSPTKKEVPRSPFEELLLAFITAKTEGFRADIMKQAHEVYKVDSGTFTILARDLRTKLVLHDPTLSAVLLPI